MFRRILYTLLAALVVMSLLAGCGQAEPEEPETPAEPEKTYKIALVIGLLGDRSFLDSAARGIDMANAEFDNIETKIIENADVGEQQLAARAMAEEGYDLVITVGFGSADWTNEIALEYPDTHFAIVDATLEAPNGTGLTFREDEGSFTVGMAAAMLTKTGKVGYIGGMDVPILRRFEEGYIQGVKYVDPNIEVVSGWVGAFNDPTKGKELALTQYEEGVDIIFAAAGKSGEGVLAASAEKGLFSIGVDSDQCYIEPGNVIASMMKMVDLSVFNAIESLVGGTLEGGTQVYGLKENAVGMCHLYDIDTYFQDNGPEDMATKLEEEVIPAVEAAVEKIKSGEMCVRDHMEVFPCDTPPEPGGMNQ
ncbi:MAG: BMP family ABC transporter substrate-binding protein [Anaerolineae bacterium]|nr:BMP family ABC transporter substrate-binding protein [Anaerolineae bacterium]